jgi:DNA-binding transcriptional MerR regulator
VSKPALRLGALPTAREFVASLQDEGDGTLFGIGDLCRAFGVTPRTLRFYETKGLLTPRRINGSRIYTRRDRGRLSLILRAKAIGSSLSEIRHFLDLYGAHGEGRVRQARYVLERTDAAIQQLSAKRAQIDETLAELRVINAACRKQLEDRRK